ncbi:MAG: hypothetical protein ACQKHC_02120 [Candidatus Phytoplasma pruni]|uniref:hypothetical protein n=1 Tax=Milkweed yellows phytoplasma TaxID=208434 RepID=UPI00037618F0|nr:hypothetical protein [Milkweed yellows phytoplasma]
MVQDEDLKEFLGEEKLKDLTDSILQQIKHLFTTFINKNNLPENKIKMQIVDKIQNTEDPSQNMNMRLDIIQEKEEGEEAKYYWCIINDVLSVGIREERITLNFTPLKIYLDKKSNKVVQLIPNFLKDRNQKQDINMIKFIQELILKQVFSLLLIKNF